MASPAKITVSLEWPKIDFDMYKSIAERAERLARDHDVFTWFEGDIDAVRILKEPERYNVDMRGAFKAIQDAGKEIGMSVTVRLDNTRDRLDMIRSALCRLEALESEIDSE